MSWYDDDDGAFNVPILAGIIREVYARNRRHFNKDVEHYEGRMYVHSIIHLLTAFGIYIGYGYRWYGYPYSGSAFSSFIDVYNNYTKKLVPMPEIKGIDKEGKRALARYLDFIEEAGDDPKYLRLLSSIAFVVRTYGYENPLEIKNTIENSTKTGDRFDEAIALCRKHKILE